jgi:hypothetical protein
MSKLGLLPAASATVIALSLLTVPAINTAAAETGPDLSAGKLIHKPPMSSGWE